MASGCANGYLLEALHPLKAHVQNGRLVLDEPTDLPEGAVVELVRADEALLGDDLDDLDDEERARLHQAIDRGLDDVKAGRTVDAAQVIQELRARAASR